MKTCYISVFSPERKRQHDVLYTSIKTYIPNVDILAYTPVNYTPRANETLIDISQWLSQSPYTDNWYTYTYLRPKAILDAFKRGYEAVILLGADTEFFSQPREDLLDNKDAFVTMYTYEPYPDEILYPNNIQTIEVGQINADYIGFRKTEKVISWLTWLDKQMSKYIVINKPYNKIYLDQGWFSTCFSFLDKVEIIRELGYNVANYNLHNRGLQKLNNKWIMKDGSPLVLFHYAGFEKGKEENISKHQDRYKAEGDLLEFLREYGNKI